MWNVFGDISDFWNKLIIKFNAFYNCCHFSLFDKCQAIFKQNVVLLATLKKTCSPVLYT